MTAAFAVMLAASMPMAYAQTTHNAPATEGAGASAPATQGATDTSKETGSTGSTASKQPEVHLGQGQILFSKMNGAAVYDQQNKEIGDVNNVVLDPQGQVAAVVIKSGGFLGLGGKTFAVPMNAVKMTSADNGNLRFQVSMTQEQVKTAPTYDLSPQSTATGSSSAPAEQRGTTGAGNGGTGSSR
jgi:sporulation protein YlmC with PRC-barrel domain